ncbi:MAG TPA: hypothetical protein DCR40_09345 [Prolixibacteraceae bacterium]|nr:hypothetical protein [Prolixibacteraceae bacterium]
MKKFLFILLAGFILVPAFAQKGKKDLVYLKSGGIIKGQLIFDDGEKVKINSAGNEWVFNSTEVDSVAKYSKAQREQGLTQNYFFDTSMGVLLGNSGNNQSAPFSFTSSLNYRILDQIYVGAGLGAEFFDESYMPVFGQVQYKFRNTKFTPFFNLLAGYEVALEEGNRQHYSDLYYSSSSSYYPYPNTNEKLDAEGGFLINPSVGFQRFTSDNFGWFFSFGFRHHQLNYSGDKGYKLETNFSRLSLKIGFIFN